MHARRVNGMFRDGCAGRYLGRRAGIDGARPAPCIYNTRDNNGLNAKAHFEGSLSNSAEASSFLLTIQAGLGLFPHASNASGARQSTAGPLTPQPIVPSVRLSLCRS